MDIKLIRLKNKLTRKDTIEKDNNFITEINDELFDFDLVIKEDATDPIFTILYVESSDVKAAFKRVKSLVTNPTVILTGSHESALKSAFEVNSYLINEGKRALMVNGNDTSTAGIVKEIAKIANARKLIDDATIGIIGEDDFSLNKENDDIYDKYHIKPIYISRNEFIKLYDASKGGSYPHKDIINKIFITKKAQEVVNKLYNTIMDLVKLHNLKAISFNIDVFSSFILPVASLLNEVGIATTYRTPISGTISLLVLNSFNESLSIYGDAYKINLDKNTLTLISSSIPYNMINKEDEINKGNVTLYRIAPNHKNFLLLEGKITSSKRKDDYSFEIEITLEENEMVELYHIPFGGSLSFGYGESLGNILAYENLLGDKK